MDNSSKVAVQAAVEYKTDNSVKNKITCSTGVVFKTNQVSLGLLQDINKMYNAVKPKVPVYFNEAKGRTEENPDHPDYIQDRASWQNELLFSQMDALIMMGTEVLHIPNGISSPQEDAWMVKYEILGLDIDPRPEGRYLAWVKYIAAPSSKDIKSLTETIGKSTGVSEEEVNQAVDRFRG